MISGVPAAAIRPMKAMLEPIDSRFLTVRKNGDNAVNTAIRIR